MKYSLVDDEIWKIVDLDNLESEVTISRGSQSRVVKASKLKLISPEFEAEKILQYCAAHLHEMDSFGDIDELMNIDRNELLPFTQNFSIEDEELLSFLNETMDFFDEGIKRNKATLGAQ